MATKKKPDIPEVTEPHPSVILVQGIDHKALAGVMRWADKERRSAAATTEAERALQDLARTASEIATEVGDIATDAHEGTPIERERHAKKIQRALVALEKVHVSVTELAHAA